MSKVSLTRYWLLTGSRQWTSHLLSALGVCGRGICVSWLLVSCWWKSLGFFLYRTNRNMIVFWGLCRKLYYIHSCVGLMKSPIFDYPNLDVNQPQCLGWDGMFPVGRLATSASQNPQTSAQWFCSWNIWVLTYKWLIYEYTFIYVNIVAIHSTFLIFYTYCIGELIPRMMNLMKTRPFRTETD